jgi:hypothetical protein
MTPYYDSSMVLNFRTLHILYVLCFNGVNNLNFVDNLVVDPPGDCIFGQNSGVCLNSLCSGDSTYDVVVSMFFCFITFLAVKFCCIVQMPM